MKKDELRVLIPSVEVETSTGTIVLNPFKFKDFPKALAIVNRYVEIFSTAEDTMSIVSGLLKDAGELTLNDVASLIELASGKTRDTLNELTYDEVVNMLATVVEQNMDFFNRIGKKLTKTEEETPSMQIEQKQETTVLDGATASVA